MYRTPLWGLALSMGLGFASGCSQTSDDELTQALANMQQHFDYFNGCKPNGNKPNGNKPNGCKPNGNKPNGTIINMRADQGAQGQSKLVGYHVEAGTNITGAAFVGARITARFTTNEEEQADIVGHDNTTVPGKDLYLALSAVDGQPMCGYDSSNNPIWATVMNDLFDADTGAQVASDPNYFTLACRFGAIEKCNEYGYTKWIAGIEQNGGASKVRNFNDYHAACVRMVRADYCGDGAPHTYDGTSIDIYDHLQDGNAMATSTTGADGYYFEAYWRDDGAHCIKHTRWMPSSLTTMAENLSTANPIYNYVRVNCPDRLYNPPAGVTRSITNCDNPNFNTSVGYSMYPSGTSTQPGRLLTANNSKMNRY